MFETSLAFRLFRLICIASLSLSLTLAISARADEPYAPSRDYDLENIRTHLWLDPAHRSERGEVSESVATLREGVSQLRLDSVDLKIKSVLVDGKTAKFEVEPKQLIISLDHPATRGEKHEILIRYEGKPSRGLFFILPDKGEPQEPTEVWTQGEAEDTRYYIPLYDYPNDRTTSEMLLTVPAQWITVSNGQLESVKDDAEGTRTWDWKQAQPLSTYLISAIAGDFVEHQDSWNGITLRYVVPRGEEAKIEPTFAHTKEMLELFSTKFGVPYPWPQYSQTAVDDFTAGGMENTSATTVSTRDLIHPALAGEMRTGDDIVISHELTHQWFGDLVTCKDWANLWLNEGFATYFEHYWIEQHFGQDEADYTFWRDQSRWFGQKRMFPEPIVNHDFDDSTEYASNIYTKAGWVLRMLREKLGDENFFAALQHYLVVNRGQNVMTADLQKAIEQTTNVSVDKFFDQWIYGAGAPELVVGYDYDSARHQVNLDVTQNQKQEGRVGLFDVAVEIEITTASGSHNYPVEIDQASQTFHFPVDGAPVMVVFDKGDKVFKSLDFNRDPALLTYQLKHGETVPDRADAAFALAAVHNQPDVVTALGDAVQHDPFWGVRVEALKSLRKIGGPGAEKQILDGLGDEKPWVREVAVELLTGFKDDPMIVPKLTSIAANDPAYRVRAAALRSIGEVKAPNALEILDAAAKSDSPDGILRDAALDGFGALGDDRAVTILKEWSELGKPLNSRQEAISSIAQLDKRDAEITRMLLGYLHDPHFDVKTAAMLALGARGDTSAIGPLQEMRADNATTSDEARYIDMALGILRAGNRGK